MAGPMPREENKDFASEVVCSRPSPHWRERASSKSHHQKCPEKAVWPLILRIFNSSSIKIRKTIIWAHGSWLVDLMGTFTNQLTDRDKILLALEGRNMTMLPKPEQRQRSWKNFIPRGTQHRGTCHLLCPGSRSRNDFVCSRKFTGRLTWTGPARWTPMRCGKH